MKCFFWLMLLSGSIFFETFSAGTRNLIMPIDWGKERVSTGFNHIDYAFHNNEYGPVTHTLITGLHQQVAPIIVSSATWVNAIERAKMFADSIAGKDLSFLEQYVMFKNPQHRARFAQDLRAYYDPSRDLMRENNLEAATYYYLYQTFYAKNPVFKPDDWIVKKISDYLYLFIPKRYLNELRAKQDTPAIGRQLSTPLTVNERLLGMKFEKFPDIPAATLLNVHAHATTIKNKEYKKLVAPLAYGMIENLLRLGWHSLLTDYIFSQHIVAMLPQIFITHSDLKFPTGNAEETDINETYFLHEWLIFLHGHGSTSKDELVLPVVYSIGNQTTGSIAFTAGLEHNSFRQLLGFLNNRVSTGSLLYTSCYSGGLHLFKLFEHHWDYPQMQKVGSNVRLRYLVQGQKDVFNFLIIATNRFYTVTTSGTFLFHSSAGYFNRVPAFSMQFNNYFEAMAQFLHKKMPAVQKQNGSKKQKIVAPQYLEQELARALQYVAIFNLQTGYQIPAIRLPYTEWFVPLTDAGTELRLETEQVRKAREQQEAQTRLTLEVMRKKKVPEKVLASIKQLTEKEGVYKKEPRKPGQVNARWTKVTIDADAQALKEKQLKEQQEKARLEKERLEKEEKDRKENQARIDALRKKQEAEARAQNQKPTQSKPPAGKPTPSSPLKPLPNQPNIQWPPPSPIPMGSKPLTPGTLPPPPGTVGQKPTKPVVPLQQALTQLKSSLFYVVDALLK